MEPPVIYVVDDDDSIREAFTEVLTDCGYSVQNYRNGREAVDALDDAEPPSLILLDWMMPEMSGEEFIQRDSTRHFSQDTSVAVVSAMADRLSNIPGVLAFVTKPIRLQELLETVGKFCGRNIEKSLDDVAL